MGGRTRTYRYCWVEVVPLRDGKEALRANWLGVEVLDMAGKVTYRGAFITSLAIGEENVAEIAACARARWKIENESFNVLKNHGYHLKHNVGHGKQYLAQLYVVLHMPASFSLWFATAWKSYGSKPVQPSEPVELFSPT